MERRNVVINVVQDRSKLQSFPPTVFKMSSPPQQQQQPTAEKSVQTQELLTNNSLANFHAENTAAEVANTLVSMAAGSQRTTNVKQVNLISVPTATSLPILSLADYTTTRGVPTAMALASQAKLSPVKHEEIIDGSDDNSMSTTEDFHSNSSVKSRSKSTRTKLMSKAAKKAAIEPIQYGPILVKPRKTIAPTLANGRKSKDEPLPPDETVKRQQRRDRNREAAAKCRRRRNELRQELEENEKKLLEDQKVLERNVQMLTDQRNQLDVLLQRHLCVKKTRFPSTNSKNIPTTSLIDSNNNNGNSKRVTINIGNAQELFSVNSLPRTTTTTINESSAVGSSTNVPMITIHILPEVAQALFGSTLVDRTKLAELLQQSAVATTTDSSSSQTIVAHPSDST